MIAGNSETAAGSKRLQHANPEADNLPGLKSVELSQGSAIEIVNISRNGLILETATRLRPDFKVVLKVVTSEGPMRIHGVVLRTAICSLTGGPRYRSEVEFKQPLKLVDEAIAQAAVTGPTDDTLLANVAEVETTKGAAILTALHAATMAPA